MVSSILDRFEESFERLVEGSVGRVFKTPIQPAEIGRKLERAMVTNQVVSVDSTIVPNDYRVVLNPQDMIAFADLLPGLGGHLNRRQARRQSAPAGRAAADRALPDRRQGKRRPAPSIQNNQRTASGGRVPAA